MKTRDNPPYWINQDNAIHSADRRNQMGQYLAIGLPCKIFVSPDRTYNQTVSLEEVREEMERSLLYDMNLFESEETEDSQVFTLKDELLKEGLKPFLESFYPKIYYDLEDVDSHYPQALEKLRSTPFEEWFEFARAKYNYAFQMDDYAEPQYLRIQKDFRPVVCLRSQCLLLYLGSGKVITEGISDLTRFFKYCFQETFSEHPIAKAVKIYITG